MLVRVALFLSILAIAMIAYGSLLPTYHDPVLAEELRQEIMPQDDDRAWLRGWYQRTEANRTYRFYLMDAGFTLLSLVACMAVFLNAKRPAKKSHLLWIAFFMSPLLFIALALGDIRNLYRDFYHPNAEAIIINFMIYFVLCIGLMLYLVLATFLFMRKRRGSMPRKKGRKLIFSVQSLFSYVNLLLPAGLLGIALLPGFFQGNFLLVPVSFLWIYLVLCWRTLYLEMPDSTS